MNCNCSTSTPIRFISGETQALTFKASDPRISNFTIQSASYTITQKGVEIQTGDCTITGQSITALVTMDEIGFFDMVITYKIGQEVLKAMFVIQVSDNV